MKHRKAKPESKPTPPVRWIPVLDIQDLAAVKTRVEIVAIIEAANYHPYRRGVSSPVSNT